jgi:hypothetical protein
MPTYNELDRREVQKHLHDRWWRLNHLYYVKNEKGEKVLFKPNEVQQEIHDNLWYFVIIPKARQLGVTTFFTILYLDQVLFSENKTAGIIAHRQEDLKKIFRNKIRFAWDNLPTWLRSRIGNPKTDSQYELEFPNGSNIFVSMSVRSGTVQFLHISEFGYICYKFPEKAEEIVTGSINAVHPGCMVSIESTAKGKEGYFYDFCMEAQKNQQEGRKLSKTMFKIFFFPWWRDKRYVDDSDVVIDNEMQKYFTMVEGRIGKKLSDAQKRWYINKANLNKDKIYSEYPSFMEECFQQSTAGAYYSKQMESVYKENRIMKLPVDVSIPIDTFWDLGVNDFNVILLVQTIGPQIWFVDMIWGRGEGLKFYVKELEKRRELHGYKYRNHYFPHDIQVQDLSTGITRKQTLSQLGMAGMHHGEKWPILDGIDLVRNLFPRFWFDIEKCDRLHRALFNYRKDFDKKLGQFKDRPKHDSNSHFADPVRLLGHFWRESFGTNYATFDDTPHGESKDQCFFA